MREMKDSGVEWIGEIPKNWKLKRMKYFCDERVESSYYNKNLDTYIGLENIESYADELIETSSEYPEKVYDFCHDGDVLFGKLRPYLAKCIIAPFSANCTGELLVLYSKENNHRFIRYWLLSDDFLKKVDSSTYGAKMPRANSTYILNLPVPDVSVMEQAAIVSYLDRHCAAIDRTIKATKASIDKLKEYKRAIIARAVTKGLNPDAEMKNSEVDWIGEIPVTWDTINLKYTGSFDNGLTYAPADVKDNGLLVLRSSNIQDGTLDFKDCVYVEKVPKNLLVKKGDIIICSRNGSAKLVGKCALVDNELNATFGAFMMRYRTNLNHVFAYYLLQVALYSNRHLFSTTTINQLTRGIIVQIKVAIPTEQEQENIVVYLADRCKYIDNLIAKKEQLIAKFTEYRQSLIYAAVTGKIDCREEETA